MAAGKARTTLISFLKEIGTDKLSHSGRSLSRHLIGTFDLLKKWGCDEATCIAGGLHSIYGTNIFVAESLSRKARLLVRQRFGADAERLAWLFGSLNRPKAIERGSGIDRRSRSKVKLDAADLLSLRLIEAANLMEQGESLEEWPNIMKEAKKYIP